MKQFDHRWLKNRVLDELLDKSLLDLPVRPPKHARYLASLLPKAIRVPFVGDVEEEYPQVVAELGHAKAARWYWILICSRIAGYVWERLELWKTSGRLLALVLFLLCLWVVLMFWPQSPALELLRRIP